MISVSIFLFILTLFSVAQVSIAQEPCNGLQPGNVCSCEPPNLPRCNPSPAEDGFFDCDCWGEELEPEPGTKSTSVETTGIKYTVKSPLSESITSIEGLLSALLSIFIVIATPIIVLYIIYAGFLYVTARGNPTKIQEATTALTYAIIGGVILLGSVALSEILSNIINAFRA